MTGNAVSDHIRYVSQSGNDGNDGLSWGTAFRSVRAGLSALSATPGKVYVGAGVFSEQPGLKTNQQQRVVGAGRSATTIQLAANGNLFDEVNTSDGGLEDMSLSFATGVTGTLIHLSNAFRHTFKGLELYGQTAAGQVGTLLDANAGDSTFFDVNYFHLDVHVQNNTAVNYWVGGSWGAHLTAGYQSGSPDGSDKHDKSAVLSNITFLGSGPAYVNLNGYSAAHVFSGCWWDGGATTAVVVGNSTYGPRMVTIRDSPNIAGAATTLLINKVGRMVVEGNLFGDTGSHPKVVSIPNTANVPSGWCGQNFNLGASPIASFFPSTWKFGA